jgi:hypothetical protein
LTFDISILVVVALLFFLLAGILMLVTFYISYRRKSFRNKKKTIKALLDATISEHLLAALDDEDVDNVTAIPDDIRRLMSQRFNRNLMIAELVTARKSFSGKAGNSIQSFYEQLKLNHHSGRKLFSGQWHVRARAIQELSIMQQRQYWKHIYRLTNHKNDHLRMEAQAGVIRLLGFSGLRFLNVTTHTISEWQMINLLQLLKDIPAGDFKGVDRWLRSSNPYVVAFALKIISKFRKYELHDEVIACLMNSNPLIKNQALKTITVLGLDENIEMIA